MTSVSYGELPGALRNTQEHIFQKLTNTGQKARCAAAIFLRADADIEAFQCLGQ
jgi:hypothetical protein